MKSFKRVIYFSNGMNEIKMYTLNITRRFLEISRNESVLSIYKNDSKPRGLEITNVFVYSSSCVR